MWMWWYYTPATELRIAIIDKTVLTPEAPEHASFNWVLTKEKYTQPGGALYQTNQNYFGFFPGENPDPIVKVK